MITFSIDTKLRIMLTDMFKSTYRIITVGILLFIIGCTEKDEGGHAPLIQLNTGGNLISSDTVIAPGQLMEFSVSGQKGNYNITNFVILVSGDSSQVYYDSGMNVTSFNWTGKFAKSYEDNEVWEFIVRDRYSRSDKISILIQNDTLISPGPINSYTDILLGAQANSDLGGCFSLSNKQFYFIDEAFNNQELIDMIYYLGEDNETLASPGANIEDGVFPDEYEPKTWSYRNTTRYIKTNLSPEAFNSIHNDSLLLISYIEGDGKRKAKELHANDVYSFKTQGTKYGMFLITDVLDSESGSVKIDIKIQE